MHNSTKNFGSLAKLHLSILENDCTKEDLGRVILKFAKVFKEKFTEGKTNWEKTNTCLKKYENIHQEDLKTLLE